MLSHYHSTTTHYKRQLFVALSMSLSHTHRTEPKYDPFSTRPRAVVCERVVYIVVNTKSKLKCYLSVAENKEMRLMHTHSHSQPRLDHRRKKKEE